jgi:hypothetical protein
MFLLHQYRPRIIRHLLFALDGFAQFMLMFFSPVLHSTAIKSLCDTILLMSKVDPSTPRPEGLGLLRVDPEPFDFPQGHEQVEWRRFPSPPSKAGLSAAEWVDFT